MLPSRRPRLTYLDFSCHLSYSDNGTYDLHCTSLASGNFFPLVCSFLPCFLFLNSTYRTSSFCILLCCDSSTESPLIAHFSLQITYFNDRNYCFIPISTVPDFHWFFVLVLIARYIAAYGCACASVCVWHLPISYCHYASCKQLIAGKKQQSLRAFVLIRNLINFHLSSLICLILLLPPSSKVLWLLKTVSACFITTQTFQRQFLFIIFCSDLKDRHCALNSRSGYRKAFESILTFVLNLPQSKNKQLFIVHRAKAVNNPFYLPPFPISPFFNLFCICQFFFSYREHLFQR